MVETAADYNEVDDPHAHLERFFRTVSSDGTLSILALDPKDVMVGAHLNGDVPQHMQRETLPSVVVEAGHPVFVLEDGPVGDIARVMADAIADELALMATKLRMQQPS